MSEFRPNRIRRVEQWAFEVAERRNRLLGNERATPLDVIVDDDSRILLGAIDRALLIGDVQLAWSLERTLPATIDAEPATVERMVTLRLLEGDAVTALALLGAVARPTPRLDLLRAVALIAMDDRASLELHLEELSDCPAERPLASVLGAILGSLASERASEEGRDVRRDWARDWARHNYPDASGASGLGATAIHSDPTPAFCAIVTATVAARSSTHPSFAAPGDAPSSTASLSGRSLTSTSLADAILHELTSLLSPFTTCSVAPSSGFSGVGFLARRIHRSLKGLAYDLGLTNATCMRGNDSEACRESADDVAIRAADRSNFHWRRPASAAIRPVSAPSIAA